MKAGQLQAGDVFEHEGALLVAREAATGPWPFVMRCFVVRGDASAGLIRNVVWYSPDAPAQVYDVVPRDTGHTAAPARYKGADGTETIDLIWRALGDEGFAAFCRGQALRYHARAGKKGDPATDQAKAAWYEDMFLHVTQGTPDPRTYRSEANEPAQAGPAQVDRE